VKKLWLWICTFLFCSHFAYAEKWASIDLTGNVKAGYLYVERDRAIDHSTYLYVKYALESFRKENVRFILLDLNTPGGEVFSALRISEELKKIDREDHISVIALVDNWALSAGALLAYSCRYIGAVPQSSMGAAEPVIVSTEGKMETASEKMVSALRTEFGNAAKLYGRDPLIAEAMVDKDLLIVLRKGEIVQLTDRSQIQLGGKHPDLVISDSGKLLTLNTDQMQKFGMISFLVPEIGANGMDKLLSDPQFQGASIEWITYKDWKIGVFAFLSYPMVSSILMMGLMIGLYSLFQGNGLSFSSALGLFCLALILLSSFATECIGFLELIFLSLGLLLFLCDLFVLSGFGILGGLGIALFLWGLVAILLPPLHGFSWDWNLWTVAMQEWIYRLSLFLSVILFCFMILFPLMGMFFRKTPLFEKFILPEVVSEKDPSLDFLPAVGEVGVVFSELRPFGKVQVGDRVYEAQTEEGWISSGMQVEILAHSGSKLLVKEKK
jgi:membrane-bound ClpP family serine protease